MRKSYQTLEVLKAPIVTEKSVSGERRYAFRVVKTATKGIIKRAIEQAFKVQVGGVTTVNVKGKVKKRGQHMGRKKDWKKAYVVLKEGYRIDFSGV